MTITPLGRRGTAGWRQLVSRTYQAGTLLQPLRQDSTFDHRAYWSYKQDDKRTSDDRSGGMGPARVAAGRVACYPSQHGHSQTGAWWRHLGFREPRGKRI
jgi:hypothetical protein